MVSATISYRDVDGAATQAATDDAVAATEVIEIVEPITLQQSKDHLRVVIDDEDDYISALITVARQMAEGKLNRGLVQESRRASFSVYETWKLPKPPLVEVTSISYGYGEDVTVIDESSYRVDSLSVPTRIRPIGVLLAGPSKEVIVDYVSGYGPDEVPKPIIQWMLLVIGSLYENRETMSAGVQIYAIPDDFTSWLLQPYMVYE